ncbi:hypothetical protein HUS23_04315 [Ectothiorhodospiraceae bacterium 2226]|nr:hypothetical protein HUS23_04315 [Ectothiorhodospiraceae bacterium 2226]
MDDARIEALLRESPVLAGLTTQNGWVDADTLRFEVLAREGDGALVAVYFDELVMEGAGCLAARVPCYGRVRLAGQTVELV